MNTGTIARIVGERGFGFITGDDGKQYFFHLDSLLDGVVFERLAGGEKVTFVVEANPKGLRAAQVQLA